LNYDEHVHHALASKWFRVCILPPNKVNHWRFLLRKFAFSATVIAFFVLANMASAQQGDAMFGFGTLTSPGAAACGVSSATCPEKGGLYTNIGVDVIFHRRLGFGFDTAWKTTQGAYGGPGGQPFRPILFDFNGVYQPKLSKKVGLDLMGGIGWQSTRFYGFQPTSSCQFFGQCYVSSNHFLVDLGAGVRYYVWGHVFVRPEVRYYHVMNNSDAFTSGNLLRLGASIGYTIGGPE
jgi:Outer membrane protein beta-barrel domain